MKNKIILGIVLLTTLTGCQFLTMDPNEAGSRLAEKLIESSTGEKVKISGLETGNVSLETAQGKIEIAGDGANGGVGKITEKETGKEVTIEGDGNSGTVTTSDGEVYQGNSNQKPNDLPTDLPIVEGGKDYLYIKAANNVTLGFSLESKEPAKICSDQNAMLVAAGWTKSTENKTEKINNVSYTNAKDDTLNFQCVEQEYMYLNFVLNRKM